MSVDLLGRLVGHEVRRLSCADLPPPFRLLFVKLEICNFTVNLDHNLIGKSKQILSPLTEVRISASQQSADMKKTLYSAQQKQLAALLVEARKAQKLNQRELANRLERVHSIVATIELGQRRVDVIEFLEICRVLKIDPCKIIAKLQGK